MPRRPQPPTLRLAAIKAVGRWRWKILDFFSILISRHLERICYGCKNSREVKTFERNMHQFSNDSNSTTLKNSDTLAHWERRLLEGRGTLCHLPTILAWRSVAGGGVPISVFVIVFVLVLIITLVSVLYLCLSPSHHPYLKICCKRCCVFMSMYLRLPL